MYFFLHAGAAMVVLPVISETKRGRQMPAFICSTCGTQYPPTDAPPTHCPVCEDERQFIPPEGQSWTTLERLRISHHNGFRQYEPGLIGIGTTPKFAIGQRALLLCTPEGNILWDCISLIDDATVTIINGLGGLRSIAISHPHFYTTLVDWSQAFGNVPVYLHADDAKWVRQPDSCIKFWQGERFELQKGITLVRGGGHFPGGAMLHWAAGAGGKGVVCSADAGRFGRGEPAQQDAADDYERGHQRRHRLRRRAAEFAQRRPRIDRIIIYLGVDVHGRHLRGRDQEAGQNAGEVERADRHRQYAAPNDHQDRGRNDHSKHRLSHQPKAPS